MPCNFLFFMHVVKSGFIGLFAISSDSTGSFDKKYDKKYDQNN